MYRIKGYLLLIVLILVSACSEKEKHDSRIWNDVVVGHVNTDREIKIKKVELLADYTAITLNIRQVYQNYWIRMTSDTYLQAGDTLCKVRGVLEDSTKTVPELDTDFQIPAESGEVEFVMIFDPLPEGTERFDFVEPNGWVLKNIRSASLLPKGIKDTYWINPKTGDWFIGFAEQHVIFDNRVWDIETMKETDNDTYSFYVRKGNEMLNIEVGAMKKGRRNVTVGDGKRVKCIPVTTNHLPAYPVKDKRKDFKDNGYRMGDSVTIVGWLKDMTTLDWDNGGKEVELSVNDIFTDSEKNYYAPLDSLGRFTISIPLLNTSQAFIDWNRCEVETVIEPGETYFMLCDFSSGHKLFMGRDVRLQNEILAFPRRIMETHLDFGNYTDEELMQFLKKTDEERASFKKGLDELADAHPYLSERYKEFVETCWLIAQGDRLMMAQFYAKDFKLPGEYLDYVDRNIWSNVHDHPYTLSNIFSSFMNYHLGYMARERGESSWKMTDLARRMSEDGYIVLSEKESDALKRYEAETNAIKEHIDTLKSEEEKKSVAEAFNKGELMTTINALFARTVTEINAYLMFKKVQNMMDCVQCSPTLHDIYVCARLYEIIDEVRKPLPSAMLKWMETEVNMEAAKAVVKEKNDTYKALLARDISSYASLMSAEDVKNMSDGEKILQKLTEPYRGKLVLLDVWGTWCGPCKAALANSKEEFDRLAPYDIVFLYLANNSDEDSWKNVIKEYNVLGENVVHYNLPSEQQSAIERFLGVNSFPTYKLIDRNGCVLDVNADPRNLDALDNMLKQMK